MRVDASGKKYHDFWDWLWSSWHLLLIAEMPLGYVIYLLDTKQEDK